MGLKSECSFFQSGYIGSKTTSEKGPRDLRVLKAPCRFFHLENHLNIVNLETLQTGWVLLMWLLA